MAFTGVAVKTALGYNQVMITGLSLAATVSGTIGDFGDATADVQLPTGHAALALTDQVIVNKVANGAVVPFTIAKVAGPPIQVSITNADVANASGGLEIWIRKSHKYNA